jgi:hypothetical protein
VTSQFGDIPISIDGTQWFDGEEWHPVPRHWLNAEEAMSEVVQISPSEFPAIARLIEANGDFNRYLTSIGVDPSDLDDELITDWLVLNDDLLLAADADVDERE